MLKTNLFVKNAAKVSLFFPSHQWTVQRTHSELMQFNVNGTDKVNGRLRLESVTFDNTGLNRRLTNKLAQQFLN